MINELNLIEDIDILFDCKIILFGAGAKGVETAKMLTGLGISPAYFCDSNTQKWGTCIGGLTVLPLPELKQFDRSDDLAIIIATDQARLVTQIIDTITRLQLRTDKVFTMLALNISITQNIRDFRINTNAREHYIETYTNNSRLVNAAQHSAEKQWLFDEYLKCMFRSCNGIDNILVYQPGKVGSTTVSYSLSAIGLLNSQLHYLSNSIVAKILRITDGFASELQNAIINQEKVKIITLFREPVSRIFSAFFYTMAYRGIGYYLSPGKSFINMCAERLTQKEHAVNESDPWLDWNGAEFQFDWFDKELNAVFGIDVYAHPFDKEKGYSVIKQENIEVLVLKSEKLNQLEATIGEFVGAPHFKIINENESAGRADVFLNKNVRGAIKLPRELFSSVYEGNPRMNHFYSEEEISAFWKKWENNIV